MKIRSGDTGGATIAQAQRTRRPRLILAGCFVLLLVLGWLDYLTGYELGFFVFYSLPVGLAAWYAGRWPGIAVAMGATISWWLADALAGAKYSTQFLFWWNSTIHFLAFVINAVSIAKIKWDLDQRHELAAQLEIARQTLRRVAKLLPECPVCGNAHAQNPEIGLTELREAAQANAELRGPLCTECQGAQTMGESSTPDPAARSA